MPRPAACPSAHTTCVMWKPGTRNSIRTAAPSPGRRPSPWEHFCLVSSNCLHSLKAARFMHIPCWVCFFFHNCKYFNPKVSNHPAQSWKGALGGQWVILQKTLAPKCSGLLPSHGFLARHPGWQASSDCCCPGVLCLSFSYLAWLPLAI